MSSGVNSRNRMGPSSKRSSRNRLSTHQYPRGVVGDRPRALSQIAFVSAVEHCQRRPVDLPLGLGNDALLTKVLEEEIHSTGADNIAAGLALPPLPPLALIKESLKHRFLQVGNAQRMTPQPPLQVAQDDQPKLTQTLMLFY